MKKKPVRFGSQFLPNALLSSLADQVGTYYSLILSSRPDRFTRPNFSPSTDRDEIGRLKNRRPAGLDEITNYALKCLVLRPNKVSQVILLVPTALYIFFRHLVNSMGVYCFPTCFIIKSLRIWLSPIASLSRRLPQFE